MSSFYSDAARRNSRFKQQGAGAAWRQISDELGEKRKITQFFLMGESAIDGAFARSLAAFTRPGTLEIPQGFFNLLGKVSVRTDLTIKIRGAGMNSTMIFCSSPVVIETMFEQIGGVSDTFEMSDLTLVGNGKAKSGYKSEEVIASQFENVGVTGTLIAAIRTNNGYSNFFRNVKLYSNQGGGLQCTGLNNNNITVHQSQIYDNGTIGIEIANAFSVNITEGNDIETNSQAGIVCYDVKQLNIKGNYIERNGRLGYDYESPENPAEKINIKADIHILAAGKIITNVRAQAVDQCVIEGNQFTPYGTFDFPVAGLSIDSPIFCTVADGLRVTNNQVLDINKIKQMVSFYNNGTKSAAYETIIDQNSTNSIGFLGNQSQDFAFSTLHNIDTPLAKGAHNYASNDIFDYAKLGGTSGYLRRAANDYMGSPVYAIGQGNNSWGYDIDLAKHPELKGKLVWFGVWYHVDDNGATVQLSLGGSTDTDGTVTDEAMPAGSFVFKSVCRFVSSGDASLYVSVTRAGGGANPILISCPVVAVAGFGANRFAIPTGKPIWRKAGAPTDGTWQTGDRVTARAPAVGQPKAFVCTVAGTPGTWVSEGNL